MIWCDNGTFILKSTHLFVDAEMIQGHEQYTAVNSLTRGAPESEEVGQRWCRGQSSPLAGLFYPHPPKRALYKIIFPVMSKRV